MFNLIYSNLGNLSIQFKFVMLVGSVALIINIHNMSEVSNILFKSMNIRVLL